MAKTIKQQIADIDTKIAALQVSRAGLEGKLVDEVDPAALQAGVFIEYTYGKGDTKRTLLGQILGRKDPAEGEKGSALLKVATGSGFDAIITTIYPAQVTNIVAAEVAVPAETPAAE